MFVNIIAYYDGGIDLNKDRSIDLIADKFGAELSGTGCFMIEPFTRDLEYQVEQDKREELIAALSAAGFSCRILDTSEDDESVGWGIQDLTKRLKSIRDAANKLLDGNEVVAALDELIDELEDGLVN
jgi:hypothetical protein